MRGFHSPRRNSDHKRITRRHRTDTPSKPLNCGQSIYFHVEVPQLSYLLRNSKISMSPFFPIVHGGRWSSTYVTATFIHSPRLNIF